MLHISRAAVLVLRRIDILLGDVAVQQPLDHRLQSVMRDKLQKSSASHCQLDELSVDSWSADRCNALHEMGRLPAIICLVLL